MGCEVAPWANGPWKDVNGDRGDYLQTQTYLEEDRSVVVYHDKIRGACMKVQHLTSLTQPHTLHAPSLSLWVHVKVILTPPCIFCMENHYWNI